MKKVIIGIFVLTLLVSTTVSAERRGGRDRMDDDDTATSTKSELRDRIKNKTATATSTKDVDETCVSAAIVEREDAIADAWSTFSTDIAATFDARKVALEEAWKITDSKERKAELKKVWQTAKKDKKTAATEYKAEKKAIWAEFKKSAKACGGEGSEASSESEANEKIEV